VSSERDGTGSSTDPVAPLYERLPRGPHRLNHVQVVRHQRARLLGAMVEAVVANGYQGVSVRQVVGLAGVSRRSFYEQFANKQECFLATFDSIAARGVKRIRRAYLASEGPLEDRLAIAFEELSEEIGTNWKDARLVVVEAQTAGPAGLERLRRITATCEQMLFSSFALAPEASPMAMPVIRGIIGGLHANMSVCLREGDAEQLRAMTEEMRRWTLIFQTPAAEHMAARLTEPMRGGSPRGHSPDGWDGSDHDDRERLLHNALRLALINDYENLCAPQIAEEASVPMDRFFELFADKNECFLAALDELGDEFLQVAADPALAGEDWPRAARRVIGELMQYLAERPLYAQTIAAGAFAAGPDAARRIRGIGHGLAMLLVQGAPERAQSSFALEGVVGAIGHTIRCQVASEQIQLLPALSDHLAYVVIAPFIGADAAAEIVIEDRPEPAPA
jgi:TetR/AcrR family transcriptional regulator